MTQETDSLGSGYGGQTGKYVTITAMPAYRQKSVEELTQLCEISDEGRTLTVQAADVVEVILCDQGRRDLPGWPPRNERRRPCRLSVTFR